jgi:predicted small metal-binding protein
MMGSDGFNSLRTGESWEVIVMAKMFKCADIGMKCGYQETADTVEQLMPKIAAHAKSAHGMTEVPKEIMTKINAAIKDI